MLRSNSRLFNIPGFNAVRALHRIINVELIFLGFCVSLFYKVIFKNIKYVWPIFIVFLTLLVVDNFVYDYGFVRFNKQEAKRRVEPLRLKMETIPAGSVVSYEPLFLEERKAFLHVDAMVVAQQFGLKLMNGYTSVVPPGYYHYAVLFNEAGRKKWIEKKGFSQDVIVVTDVFDPEIERIINKIKKSSEWVEQIRNQAVERKISLEENIIRNARWIRNENQRKNAINQ